MARVFGRREDTQAGGGDRLGMSGSSELSVPSIRCVNVHSSGVDTGKRVDGEDSFAASADYDSYRCRFAGV